MAWLALGDATDACEPQRQLAAARLAAYQSTLDSFKAMGVPSPADHPTVVGFKLQLLEATKAYDACRAAPPRADAVAASAEAPPPPPGSWQKAPQAAKSANPLTAAFATPSVPMLPAPVARVLPRQAVVVARENPWIVPALALGSLFVLVGLLRR